MTQTDVASTLSWDQISHFAGRNELPGLLDDHWERLDCPDRAVALANSWSGAEVPEDALPSARWLAWFRETGFILENEVVDRLDVDLRRVSLYRGGDYNRRRRMSWTDDLDVARWFAARAAQVSPDFACVVTATVLPHRLLARFAEQRRGESEWIVNTRGLRISVLERPADLPDFDEIDALFSRQDTATADL